MLFQVQVEGLKMLPAPTVGLCLLLAESPWLSHCAGLSRCDIFQVCKFQFRCLGMRILSSVGYLYSDSGFAVNMECFKLRVRILP